MLEEQPKRRKSFGQIFKELFPYEQAILQLKPFELWGDNNGNQTITNVNSSVDANNYNTQSVLRNNNHSNLPNNIIGGGGGSVYTVNSAQNRNNLR